jgi:nucleoside-diphosphate-sugar epimerase
VTGAGATGATEVTRDFRRCLVIGGAGMLGYEIVRRLLAVGKEVRVLDLEPLADDRCWSRVGDIRSRVDVEAACDGVEVVFQTAAAVWKAGTPVSVYEQVNVEGNRLVLDVCREKGIRRLVYTSTIDVVVDGRKPIVYGDESLPYPQRLPADAYCRTKIVAEKMVLAADGPELATCALRPVGMYGPRDRYHLENVVEMARRGNRIRLGDGTARFSHAYSENVAHAHVLAAEHLFPGSPVAGQTYFIGDHYPAHNFFDFVEPYLRELGLPVPHRRLPYRLAYALARVAEIVAPRSNFNRFSVVQTCVDHTYSDQKARRDFGYHPIVSAEEAFARTLAYLKLREGLRASTATPTAEENAGRAVVDWTGPESTADGEWGGSETPA